MPVGTTSTDEIKALAKRMLELDDEWTFELEKAPATNPGRHRYIAERLFEEGWRRRA